MPITANFMSNVELVASADFSIADDARTGADRHSEDITARKQTTRETPRRLSATQSILWAAENAVTMLKESQSLRLMGWSVQSGRTELAEFVHRIAPLHPAYGTSPVRSHCGLMHGTRTQPLRQRCDLLIAIGARFSDRVVSNPKRFAPNARILHIDIDPAEINKNIQTHGYIIGDVKIALQKLLEAMDGEELADTTDWLSQVNEWQSRYPLAYKDGILRPQHIVERVYASQMVSYHHHGSQTKSRPVLPFQQTPHLYFFRWIGNHGIWARSGDRDANRQSGQNRNQHRGRWQFPHELP